MLCDSIKPMLSDFFNKTLSDEEERKVAGHLAECESCRFEFARLETADNMLKKVICEIVAGIEVPHGLCERIENTLAVEKMRKSLSYRLLLPVKTPAVAAALLFVVLTAGILSYYNIFSPAVTHQKVVMSEPQSGPLTGSSSSPDIQNGAPATGEKVFATTNGQDIQVYDTDTEKIPGEQLKKDPASEPERSLAAKPSPPAEGENFRIFEDTQQLPEKQSSAVSSVPPGTGAGAPVLKSLPALKRGTFEEAARDVGFNPARPAYLPQGTELESVSWLSGVVYQNYRVGNFHITVSQSRAETTKFNYDESVSRGIPIDINGTKAVLEEKGPDGGYVTVSWQRGGWTFSVSGELPGEEIAKIASSLK